jgi:6-pyruvoyltetrahydropterin/6-carboxytetrahydropterin synthase
MTTPTLHRTVRVHVTPRVEQLSRGCNTFAGQPFSEDICSYFEFDVACFGPADADSGFVESIYAIDETVRGCIVPRLAQEMGGPGPVSPRRLMPDLYHLIEGRLESTLECLTWRLSPFYSITRHRNRMDTVTLCRSYTFSTSHRLHNPELDDSENERLYGKCSWPSGHGHNYVMDVSVAVPHGADSDKAITVDQIDSIIHEHVIEQFDHRYLNLDVENFRTLIPTLENITCECHRRLEPHFGDDRARLARVRVYETDRTWCEYPPQRSTAGNQA